MTLYSFLYASRSLIDAATVEAEVAQLVADAADRNRRCGITGALVYSLGRFAQVLEGPRAALHDLIGDIAADPRHTEFVALHYEPITVRRFHGWSLAYFGPSLYVQHSIALPLAQARQGAKPAVQSLLKLIEAFALRH